MMQRKFLENLGLEKEAIDKILDENSADIGKAKTCLLYTSMELVRGYKLVELIAVMQEYEKDPQRFDPEVIKCVAHRLVDMEIMLKY